MSLNGSVNLLIDALLSVFYPQRCELCPNLVHARSDGTTCATCWEDIEPGGSAGTICWKCGSPAPGKVPLERADQVRCRSCDEDEFTAARACGVYEGALRSAVLRLKREPYVCERVIKMLFEIQVRAPLNRASMIIPVPLHDERRRVRGFNQAEVVADALSKACQLPVNTATLLRTVHTERHRAGMDAKARRDSVANAFAVIHPRVVEAERILLVDDVFTTGATSSSAAGALKEAGASEVFVLTLARAR